MAGNLFLAKIDSKSKSVQEMVMNIEGLPERYFYEDGVNGVLDSSLPVLAIPIIDTGRFASPTTSRAEVPNSNQLSVHVAALLFGFQLIFIEFNFVVVIMLIY